MKTVKTLTLATVVGAALLAGFQLARAAPSAWAVVCPTVIVGVDTSKTTSADGPWLGEALGQTFLARDTLIKSITVWRAAHQDTNQFGWHLWIAEIDSFGVPDARAILLDGPTVFNVFGDGINPIPFRFEFDPPFALPGPGTYEFAIQPDPCFGFFQMLLDNKNTYPDGEVWLHGRVQFGDCIMRRLPKKFPELDLIFEIEFCLPPTTDVQIPVDSWGKVKADYR